jgi:hypothetical protein
MQGQPQPTPTSQEHRPPYTLSTKVKTISQVWEEFARGLDGPALSVLIATQGKQGEWRKLINKQALHDRKVVYEAIVRFAIHMECSNECSARWFQAFATGYPTEDGHPLSLWAFRQWLKWCKKTAQEKFPAQKKEVSVVLIYQAEVAKVVPLRQGPGDARTARDISDVEVCAELKV